MDREPVFTAVATEAELNAAFARWLASRAERTYGLLSALALAFSPSSTDSG
ncbi:hypothetical protein AB0H49_02510 [Nocardia sp. NPDC050713]|uniref:hypothetical protein n=1 Tax=Nocardia sp. NPDC050713 TaxID=3154511 RepID=UPI0034083DA6